MSAAPRSKSVAFDLSALWRRGVDGLPRCKGAGALAALAMVLLSAAPAAAREFAALVLEASTGEVLFQDDPDSLRHPASLTKMMTLYLTFDALSNGQLRLSDRMPVSAHAQSMSPTKLGVRAGQTLKVEDAIYGLVTQSANDAAVVLAEAIGGSESAFAQKMTQKARQLGMSKTVFRNASGLPDDDQVTTARDLATLALALQRNQSEYYHYFSTPVFTYGGRKLRNHNHLMERYAGMDGIKTGYINASGYNLVASAVRDGHRLVGVVFGGATTASRDAKMAALLDKGFADLRRKGGGPLVAEEEDQPQITNVAAVEPAPRKVAKPAKGKNKTTKVAARREPEPKAAKNTATSWAVQVGSFPTKAGGQKALKRAARNLPRDLAGGVVHSVAKGGKVFNARFLGLNEKEARSVCSSLKRAGETCVAVAPGA